MASADPYEVLGVKRDASPDAIRRAYRELAKTSHPDLNPGDKAAEDRFKAVAAAHDLLSDPEKRARFDRGEIDASGQERPPERRFYRGFADSAGPGGGPDVGDLGDIFGEFFGTAGGGGGRPLRMRGRDVSYRLSVPFAGALLGSRHRVTMPDNRDLEIAIPPGTGDGDVLRLRGQGGPGLNGGPAGDALIEVAVAPHPFFRREGDDVHLDVPVTLHEAVLGAKVAVPTPAGTVNLTVPPRSDSGTRLRLRGRGVPARGDRPAGDLYATLRVVLGDVDEALAAWLRDHPAAGPDPRRGMAEAA